MPDTCQMQSGGGIIRRALLGITERHTMTDIARLEALCCICGEFRTLSERTYGRVGGSVSAPLEPEFLRECQSRGVYLDVEARAWL